MASSTAICASKAQAPTTMAPSMAISYPKAKASTLVSSMAKPIPRELATDSVRWTCKHAGCEYLIVSDAPVRFQKKLQHCKRHPICTRCDNTE
eukprot:12428943-Karenia_brevis.AAC.1